MRMKPSRVAALLQRHQSVALLEDGEVSVGTFFNQTGSKG
jgi:hypothetical protein